MEKQRRPKTTDSKWGTTSGKDMGAESAYLHTIIYGLTIGGWIKHLNLRPYTVKLYFNGRMPKSNVTFLTAQRWTLLYHTL